MFETYQEPVIKKHAFIYRMLVSSWLVCVVLAISLLVGTLGYHLTENMNWLDSFFSASMIMSGMGPAEPLSTDAGKLFASIYALYSGLFLIAAMGVMLLPLFHRVLHKFHVKE